MMDEVNVIEGALKIEGELKRTFIIENVNFIVPLNTAALLHPKSAYARKSCDSVLA